MHEINASKNRFNIVVDGLVNFEDYFNSDVLLLNPRIFEYDMENILKACKFIGQNNKRYTFRDQDVLNYVFSKKYLKLPYRFNVIINDILRLFDPKTHRIEKAIYHYAGIKTNLNTDNVFNRLYFEYFLKTPWATADMFGNIDKAVKGLFRQTVNDSKNFLLHMTNLLARRQRAFLADKNTIDAIKNIFAIKDDELIIDTSQPNAENILFDEMTKAKGNIILFMFIGNYGQAAKILAEQNFIEGVDFINAMMFLSERHGFAVNFDTKSIAKEL